LPKEDAVLRVRVDDGVRLERRFVPRCVQSYISQTQVRILCEMFQ
jgi:hypothetical protein